MAQIREVESEMELEVLEEEEKEEGIEEAPRRWGLIVLP